MTKRQQDTVIFRQWGRSCPRSSLLVDTPIETKAAAAAAKGTTPGVGHPREFSALSENVDELNELPHEVPSFIGEFSNVILILCRRGLSGSVSKNFLSLSPFTIGAIAIITVIDSS